MTKPGQGVAPKPKTTIRPAVRVVPSGQKLTSQRMTIGTPQIKVVGRGRPSTTPKPQLAYETSETTQEKDSESSEDDYDPFPTDLPPPAPDSPPREFTLDPMTGLILGQAEGEPEPQPEPEVEEVAAPKPSLSEIVADVKEESKEEEVALPVVDSILPDSTPMEATETEETTETTTTISLPETSDGEPLMITGEDGVVYRVSFINLKYSRAVVLNFFDL